MRYVSRPPAARARPASEFAAAGRGARANSLRSNTRTGLIPARSSRTRAGPRACSGAARETHHPTRGRRASAFDWEPPSEAARPFSSCSLNVERKIETWPRRCSGRDTSRGVSSSGASRWFAAGAPSGREGCPASGVRARAGPRTAPRAGRRIRRARVFDERSEEFALAPAARAVEPMRVARAQEPPWDIPPARDSCGTMKWTGTGLFSPVSPVSPVSPCLRRTSASSPADQTATGVTWTSRPSPFTAFETMQYFSARASVFATSASRSARSAAGTKAERWTRSTR